MIYLIVFLFFAVPAAAVIFFAVSLFGFLSANGKNKRQPGGIDRQILKKRKITLIISSAAAFVLVSAMTTFLVLLNLAIANM